MKLYYKSGACSLASHLMLTEVGIPFEIEAVDTAAGRTESGKNYRDINANGYVPTLELDSGERISEGAAVLQYIADSNPARAYAPAPGTVERARVQQFVNYAATELHKSWAPVFSDSSTESEKAAAMAKVKSKFDYLETVFADGRAYLVGNTFSVADAYTFILVFWANFKDIDLSGWPNLSAFVDRIAARPATKSVFAAEGLA
ncbi:glutathione transferase GstA [Roseobacter denitrificans]|uniref:Glutathione S-transferase n=1 Tax=Roseobacter denitrificans (strain ATCC 33942 / OCh 114) TaxID=375451 RepID=Q16B54_ROSDO|nr:glutathione transferase GstA [Roseobacter denitrificans]ABG30789.1 glutathione S-transferase [Roseobacter denitrificans OCh 114]AVL54987.1 glutathione transferase GstA [Roseobacter denitrificans]SFG46672.1 glutathione S-transferase [Roseobacter denitrificans OCh 114]